MHITDRGHGVCGSRGILATMRAKRGAGARWKNCSNRTSGQEFPRRAAENATSRRSRGGTGRRCRLSSGVEGERHHTEAAFTLHRKRHRARLPGDRPSPNCRREADGSTLRSLPDWWRHDGLHDRGRCRGDAYGVRPRLLPWRMGRPRSRPSRHHTHHVPVLQWPDGAAAKPLRRLAGAVVAAGCFVVLTARAPATRYAGHWSQSHLHLHNRTSPLRQVVRHLVPIRPVTTSSLALDPKDEKP